MNSTEPQGSQNKLKLETGLSLKQDLVLLLFVSWSFLHTAEFILKLQVAQGPLKQDLALLSPSSKLMLPIQFFEAVIIVSNECTFPYSHTRVTMLCDSHYASGSFL